MSSVNPRQIDIDIDIYRMIESARISFEEDQKDILRRLLGIDPQPTEIQATAAQAGEGWFYGGVFLPNGTQLAMTHNGIAYRALIHNGQLWANNQAFKSLSGAAGHLTGQSLNGWNYWFAQRPGDSSWIQTDELRKQAKATGRRP